MDSAGRYDASRRRIVELVTAGDPSAPVAACPGWTVRDVVAHLAGGLGDFLARDFDAGGYANHGERTVAERRGRSLAEVLAEWGRHRADAGEILAAPTGGVLVAEIIAHEQDVRAALGRPGARDDEAMLVAMQPPLQEIDRRLRAGDRPAVRLLVDGEERVIGAGEPSSTLRISPFELFRAITGRRSARQIRAMDWSGPPRLDVFGLFGEPRADDLVE